MRFRRIGLAILGAAQLGANCVDGVTADCADGSVCAPSYPGYDYEGGLAVDGATEAEASVDASVSDALDAADVRDARDARDGR